MLKVYKGLEILLKYDPNGDIASVNSNIYAGPNHDNLSAEDIDTLNGLNWFFCEEGCWSISV